MRQQMVEGKITRGEKMKGGRERDEKDAEEKQRAKERGENKTSDVGGQEERRRYGRRWTAWWQQVQEIWGGERRWRDVRRWSGVVSDVSVICYSANHKKRHFRNIWGSVTRQGNGASSSSSLPAAAVDLLQCTSSWSTLLQDVVSLTSQSLQIYLTGHICLYVHVLTV